MAKLSLLCMLLMFSMFVSAQVHNPEPGPTKGEFEVKSSQLYGVLKQGNVNGAKVSWSAVEKLIQDELHLFDARMVSAHKNNDQEAKNRLTEVLQRQQQVYAELNVLQRDLYANKERIRELLGKFENDLL